MFMSNSIASAPFGVYRRGILPRKRGPLRGRQRRTQRLFQSMVLGQQDGKQMRPPSQVMPAVGIRRSQTVALWCPQLAAMEQPPLPRLAGQLMVRMQPQQLVSGVRDGVQAAFPVM